MTEYRPPPDLSAKAKQFWRHAIAELELEDAWQLEVLEVACRALDQAEQARKVIAKEGMVISTQHSKKAHPAVAIERSASADFVKAIRRLKIDRKKPDPRSKFRVATFPNRPNRVPDADAG